MTFSRYARYIPEEKAERDRKLASIFQKRPREERCVGEITNEITGSNLPRRPDPAKPDEVVKFVFNSKNMGQMRGTDEDPP